MSRLKNVICIIVYGLILAVSGCNTMKGLGEDIEKSGQNLEQQAEKHGANK